MATGLFPNYFGISCLCSLPFKKANEMVQVCRVTSSGELILTRTVDSSRPEGLWSSCDGCVACVAGLGESSHVRAAVMVGSTLNWRDRDCHVYDIAHDSVARPPSDDSA